MIKTITELGISPMPWSCAGGFFSNNDHHIAIFGADNEKEEFAKGKMRRPNKCKHFASNPIPADNPNGREYKPRKRSPFVQGVLFVVK